MELRQSFVISIIVYFCATSAEATLVSMDSSRSIENLTITQTSHVADNEHNEPTMPVTNDKLAQKQVLASHSITLENPGADSHLNETNFVATTPKMPTTEKPSRYEQGLEDYEEAVARVDRMKEEQQKKQHVLSGAEAIMSLFDTVSSVWHRVSNESSANHSNETNNAVDEARGVVGRFIQGDPLRGYYDFIITEGSYKFWAAFQLFTAGLMIYSTFAAIYYSKVNPVVGDYDYTSYLGGARSLTDDPEPLPSTLSSPLTELSNSYIFQTAAHGFQFVLDAIEKIPQT